MFSRIERCETPHRTQHVFVLVSWELLGKPRGTVTPSLMQRWKRIPSWRPTVVVAIEQDRCHHCLSKWGIFYQNTVI